MASAPVELSIIIPMYREAARIAPTLEDVFATLQHRARPAELVLVDDGSDDETLTVVRAITAQAPACVRVRIVPHPANRGKGAAVRTGLAVATGAWRLMMDADNACRLSEAFALLARAEAGVGMVAGSRVAPGARVAAVLHRKLVGGGFRLALRALGLRLLRDTQCGFKLYRADVAAQVVRHAREDGYVFDLEHLLIVRAAGLRVEEVGVRWVHMGGGRVSPLRDGVRMLLAARRLSRQWKKHPPAIDRLPALMAPLVVVELKMGVQPPSSTERGGMMAIPTRIGESDPG
jgi:dolichyl-phosphate beta-glucosyltransferase